MRWNIIFIAEIKIHLEGFQKGANEVKSQGLVRLNVLLQKYGVASRRKADELIQSGAVRVDQKIINTLGARVDPQAEIIVNGQHLSYVPEKAIYLLHKPERTITSRRDLQGRSTIYDLPDVRKMESNVQAVGRLDYRSEGLLVMTNDGNLAFALSHPMHAVEKTYQVLIATSVNVEEIEKLRQGIKLEDGLAKPLAVRLGPKEKLGHTSGQWIEIVVTEGRNRLIRRMMEALGLRVLRLVRSAIGHLRLPVQLKPGGARLVTQSEKEYLDSLQKDVLKLAEEKQQKKQSKGKPALKKKATLNDKDYEKHVLTRQVRNELLSKARKKRLEEKIEKKKIVQKKETTKPASKPASKPAARPASKPTARPASKPQSKLAKKRPFDAVQKSGNKNTKKPTKRTPEKASMTRVKSVKKAPRPVQKSRVKSKKTMGKSKK